MELLIDSSLHHRVNLMRRLRVGQGLRDGYAISQALLPDIGVHYYTTSVPQGEETADSSDHGDSEDTETDPGH